ncbi:MAG TPA: hypothetical protein VEL07_05310 [Planctomycetota bacterium]|nr:hypothetical protein [Planctomycetota bacterium]
MRTLILPCLAALASLAIGSPLAAADSFDDAFKTEDADRKRAAVKALADKAAAGDDEAYAKLVQAAGDRQSQDAAIAALRARSGLKPSKGEGGGYPGYPENDSPAAWQAWLKARTAEREKEEKVKEALKLAEEAKKEAATKAPGADGEPAAPGDAVAIDPAADPNADPAAAPTPAPESSRASTDLGRMDRVVFKTGGSLLCYILGKRVDDAGNLISVRVVHPDEGGEEVLSADLVARIEEDIEQAE